MPKEIKKGGNLTENKQKKLSAFHIEADKLINGILLSVSGVLSILDFTDELALLKLRRGKIKICGESLELTIYENKIVEVFGRVNNIEFL